MKWKKEQYKPNGPSRHLQNISPNTKEYLSSQWLTEASLNRYKKVNTLHHIWPLWNVKLEINNRTSRKYIKLWKMNNSLLNGNYNKKLILKEIICFSELNGQENTIYTNFGDTMEAIWRDKSIALWTYITKLETLITSQHT